MAHQIASEILKEAGETYAERHKVYGDNYKLVGKVLEQLFPDGITLKTADDHNRFHIMMLSVVKLSRYVNNWDSGGHDDSLLDLSVYSAMLLSIDQEIRDRPKPFATMAPPPPAPPKERAQTTGQVGAILNGDDMKQNWNPA